MGGASGRAMQVSSGSCPGPHTAQPLVHLLPQDAPPFTRSLSRAQPSGTARAHCPETAAPQTPRRQPLACVVCSGRRGSSPV